MHLTLSDVRRISADVAKAQTPPLDVLAATPVGEESSYAEVILTIRGCQAEPCVLVIGVSRNASEPELRASIRERLREHLIDHYSA